LRDQPRSVYEASSANAARRRVPENDVVKLNPMPAPPVDQEDLNATFPLGLESNRLTLVPFTSQLIDALERPERPGRFLRARLPDDWPDDELSGLLSRYADWLRSDPSVVGFGPWIVVARTEEAVVGSAGFIGKSDAEGTIELGFGVHADYRNRGYASEAASVLIAWALEQPDVARVIAKCGADNLPSARVLEKIGMTEDGEANGQLLWKTMAP
jgi:[ribosomal protein S5]-alanine N-acetyltransferase